jgi:hydrogenase maturation protease
MSAVVVIGVGNSMRGDDAAGLDVAACLRGEPGIEVHAHAGEGIDLIAMWEGADAVVLVDTVRSGAAPGTIHRFDISDGALPSPLRRQAGHAISVATAIELARTLGRLPGTVIVYGVEGEAFETGSAPTAAVEAAIAPLVDAVRAEARAQVDQADQAAPDPLGSGGSGCV